MAFQPSIKITQLLKSSASFTLQDSTPTYIAPDQNPDGYGSLGAPANFAGVAQILVKVQYTGEEEVLVPPTSLSGTLDAGLVVGYPLRDGVHTINTLFGIASNPAEEKWTGSGVNLNLQILSGTTAITVLTNLKYINEPGVAGSLHKIKSVDLTTGDVVLYEPFLNPIPDVPDTIYKYYVASANILVVNQGEGALIKDISNMAISNCGCDYNTSQNLIDRVLLKIAAQTAFACKNFAKAHYAATLLANSSAIKPCASC